MTTVGVRYQYKQVVELCFWNCYFYRMSHGFEQSRNRARMTDNQYNIFTVLGSKKGYEGINVALLESGHIELRDGFRLNAKCLYQWFGSFDRTLKAAGKYRFNPGIPSCIRASFSSVPTVWKGRFLWSGTHLPLRPWSRN